MVISKPTMFPRKKKKKNYKTLHVTSSKCPLSASNTHGIAIADSWLVVSTIKPHGCHETGQDQQLEVKGFFP